MAEPAPTRRASREAAASAAESLGDAALSRAELRRRALLAVVPAQPAAEPVGADALDEVAAAQPQAGEPAAAAVAPTRRVRTGTQSVSEAPLRRRRERPTPIAGDAEPVVETASSVVETASSVVVDLAITAPVDDFELLEPQSVPFVADPGDDTAPVRVADEFEAAVRLFSSTGETLIQKGAGSAAAPAPAPTPHVAGRGRDHRRKAVKRVAAASFSLGAMAIVGLLTVGMTTPAEAVAAVRGGVATAEGTVSAAPAGDVEGDAGSIQAFVAPAQVENASLDREENYSTVTMAELASEVGISNFSNFFVNDPNSPIQWPFAVGVSISYGFGMRAGRMHEGLDFTPGVGAPIQAIADGVVRVSTDSGGAYGVHIIIDHIIDGKLISSHYAHMLYGSRQVQVGDHVKVGEVIGHTGNTGHSFGAHTHFELLKNGTTPIDPLPWLREHAGG